MQNENARDLINAIFEEEALLIGGLVAVHGMSDDLVWRLMKNLGAIRRKHLARVAGLGNSQATRKPPLHPHPAVEDFLAGIRGAP